MDLALHVDWGNIPAGIGSILTGLSLLLGYRILRRDRRNAERAQAEQVSGHLTVTRDNTKMRLYVHDASASYVYQPALVTRTPRSNDLTAAFAILTENRQLPPGAEPTDFWWQIQPGETVTIEENFTGTANLFSIRYLYFQDAHGRNWRRHLTTGKLTRDKGEIRIHTTRNQNPSIRSFRSGGKA